MAYTIVGLFRSQENAKPVSEALENAGIKNEDYIIYKTQKEETVEKPLGFLEKLFGSKKPNFVSTEEDKLITSVAIHDEDEMKKVKEVFHKNDVVHIYELQDMSLEQAKDLNYVKKIVSLRAKSHIYGMPDISVNKGGEGHEGINSEVKS